MGTITHSIGIGGTHDYTSLAAWAAALPANLVTDGNAQRAELYFNGAGDGEFIPAASTTLLALTGHATDPTHNITITTGPGQSFRDNANVRTNPLTYDATKGVGLRVNVGYTGLISIGDRDVILSNLQVYMDGGNSHCIVDTAKIDLQINNCLIVHRSNYNGSYPIQVFNSGQSTLVMRNCCVVHNPPIAGTTVAIFSFNYVNLYNCTLVVPQGSAGTTTYPIWLQYGTLSLILKNCAIFGFTDAIHGIPSIYTSCATDLASPPTGFTGSLTYSDQFVDTTLSGGYDFRLKPGSFLIDHGAFISPFIYYYAGGSERNDHSGGVGVSFVPTTDITITQLGLRAASGNTGGWTVELREWISGSLLLLQSTTVDLTGAALGTYRYAPITTTTLIAGHNYYIGALVTNGGQSWADDNNVILLNVTSVFSTWFSTPGTRNLFRGDMMYVGVDFATDIPTSDISNTVTPSGFNYDIGAWEYIAGLVTHSVGIGGTHDYTSLSAWTAALPASLVADGNAQRAELYFNGPGDGEFTGNTVMLNLTGHTTDTVHTITVTTGPGQSFRDRTDVRTNALKYDPSKGVAISSTVGYTATVRIYEANVILRNLQIINNSNSHAVEGNVGFQPFTIDNCIIVGTTVGSPHFPVIVLSSSPFIMRNTLVISRSSNLGTTIVQLSGATAVPAFYNCTFVRPSDLTPLPLGVYYEYFNNLIMKNCAVFGATSAATASTNYTNCATDAASPPTGFTGSLTYASQFEGTTSSAPDFRSKRGAFLRGGAIADAVNAAFDISGLARPSGGAWDIGAWELALAIVTHSIGIGGTHDYTSLSAWAAALPANLVTDASAQRAELYFNGSGDGEFVTSGTSLLTLTGHTTNSFHAITITTGPGQSFRDHASVRTNALRYDPTKGVALLNTLFYGGCIYNNDSNVTISNLQCKETAGPGATISSGCYGPITIENCLLESTNIGGNNWSTLVINYSTQAIVRNCVIINSTVDNSAALFAGSQAIYYFYFCTFVRPSDLTPLPSYPAAVRIAFTYTVTFKNCAVFGATTAVDTTQATYAITSCVTDQTSPPAGFTSVAYANQFENALSTAQDWRLKTGSSLINAGTADTVNGAFDISGAVRPIGTGYDIGAWEFGAAGPATQTLTAILYTDMNMKPTLPRIV